MPNPTQADVVGSAALRVGGMGTFGAPSLNNVRQSGAGEWVGTLGARADINVLSPNKVRQA